MTKHKTALIPALYQLLDAPLSYDDVMAFDGTLRARQAELEAAQAASDQAAEAVALHDLARLHAHYGSYALAQRFYNDALQLLHTHVPLDKRTAPSRLELLMGAAFACEKTGALLASEEHLRRALDLATRFEVRNDYLHSMQHTLDASR